MRRANGYLEKVFSTNKLNARLQDHTQTSPSPVPGGGPPAAPPPPPPVPLPPTGGPPLAPPPAPPTGGGEEPRPSGQPAEAQVNLLARTARCTGRWRKLKKARKMQR